MFRKVLLSVFLALYLWSFLSCSHAWAENGSTGDDGQPSMGTIELDAQIKEGWASSPFCPVNMSDMIVWATTLTSMFSLFASGVKLYRAASALPPGSPWGIAMKTTAASMVVTAAGVSLGIIYSSILPMCFFAFVRNPVAHYSEHLHDTHPDYPKRGKMMKRMSPLDSLNPQFDATDKHWEAEWSSSSDKLYICMRYPNMLNLGFDVGCETGTYGGFFGLGDETNWDLYRGPNSRLCSEEWQSLGVDFATKKIDTFPFMQQLVRKDANNDYVFFDKHRYVKALRDVKVYSSPVHCAGPITDRRKINLHGYTFRIDNGGNTGTKMCAYLSGFGAIPLAHELSIGCHKRPSVKAYPKCQASKPIREDGEWDPETGTIKPDTGTGKIVDYDNTECYGCGLSASCIGNGDMRPHKAVIPFTSIAIRCIQESSTQIIHGCSTGEGGEFYKGYLQVMQERLREVTNVILTLAVAFFSLGLLVGGAAQITKKDMMVLMLKFSFVGYLTFTDSLGYGGMQKFTAIAQAVATQIMTAAAVGVTEVNGVCVFPSSSYEIEVDGVMTDYKYLMAWDALDCYVGFMLGLPMVPMGALGAASSGDTPVLTVAMLLNAFLFVIASILGGPFMPLLLLVIFAFAIIVLIFAIWTAQMAILASVCFTLLIMLSPIFVPMLLFETTKPIFDGWLRETAAYLITTILLQVFLWLAILCIARYYFGKTQFEPREVYMAGKKVLYFFVIPIESCAMHNPTGEYKQGEVICGCDKASVACWLSGVSFITKTIIFNISVTGLQISESSSNFGDAIISYLILIMVTALFLYFIQDILMSIIVELGGARGLFDMAAIGIRPREEFGKVVQKAVAPMSESASKLGGKIASKTSRSKGAKVAEDGGRDKGAKTAQGEKGKSADVIRPAGTGASDSGTLDTIRGAKNAPSEASDVIKNAPSGRAGDEGDKS